MGDHAIKLGFLLAGAYNIVGTLVVTLAFTSDAFFAVDPVMFSRPACALVMLWGAAYTAQSRYWKSAPLVTGVFAVEKLFYAGWWVYWLSSNAGRLGELWSDAPLAGFFFSCYGVGDALFGAFFVYAVRKAGGSR